MNQFAKLVSGRLKAQPAPGPHPAPELLASFAENALPESDRGPLLQHVAACDDCREILFLALPESPEPQRVLALKPSPFRRWRLTWAAAFAAVVIASVLFTTNRLGHNRQTPGAAVTVPAGPTGTETRIAAETPLAALDQMQSARDAGARKKTAVTEEDEIKPQPEAKRMTGKMQAPLVFDQSGEVHLRASTQPANAPVAADDEGTDKDKREMQRQGPAAAALSGALAQPASAGQSGDSAFTASQQAAFSVQKAVQPMANLQWTVSPAGVVQHSSDSGKTWQPVSVAIGASFRGLSALGANIWVGGKSGALYHSPDSGQTWVKVEPAAGGKKLDQDIAGVDFSDALNGAISTANGEVWTTSDGGRTWQLK